MRQLKGDICIGQDIAGCLLLNSFPSPYWSELKDLPDLVLHHLILTEAIHSWLLRMFPLDCFGMLMRFWIHPRWYINLWFSSQGIMKYLCLPLWEETWWLPFGHFLDENFSLNPCAFCLKRPCWVMTRWLRSFWWTLLATTKLATKILKYLAAILLLFLLTWFLLECSY